MKDKQINKLLDIYAHEYTNIHLYAYTFYYMLILYYVCLYAYKLNMSCEQHN